MQKLYLIKNILTIFTLITNFQLKPYEKSKKTKKRPIKKHFRRC